MRPTYLESLTTVLFLELGRKDVNPCQAQVAQASDRPTRADPHLQNVLSLHFRRELLQDFKILTIYGICGSFTS
jgi:hypothetical protein